MEALGQLKGAIAHCEKVQDYVSRDLFSEILENEEQHVDTLESQFDMIARMGLQNYIQLQSESTGSKFPPVMLSSACRTCFSIHSDQVCLGGRMDPETSSG
jgi:hypothetical protein